MSIMHVIADRFGEMRDPRTAVATLLDVMLYFTLTLNVARARGRLKVEAPSTDGPPEFRRIYRVQMNTLEQLALHLPVLWIAALSVGDIYAAAFGLLWPIGRAIYARDYYRAPKTRSRGFIMSMVANLGLFIGAVVGVIASF